MSKSQHSEAQMIGALKQLEAGRKAEDVAREVGVSKHTIYAWKAKYGGMEGMSSPPKLGFGRRRATRTGNRQILAKDHTWRNVYWQREYRGPLGHEKPTRLLHPCAFFCQRIKSP